MISQKPCSTLIKTIEQRLPEAEPPVQMPTAAATFPLMADLPAQGDELFAAEAFGAEVPVAEPAEPPREAGVGQDSRWDLVPGLRCRCPGNFGGVAAAP